MQKINIVVIGHIDHGKSTLMGRLLYDSGSLPEEKIEEVKKTAEKLGKDMELAFFIDSLEEEREDAMTIDIMHIPLKINGREYLLIDCPGHKELIKNMLSGASEADRAILIISAKKDEGVQEQTKRHLFLAKMLGIEQVFIVINKMDEVSYNEERFNEIKNTINKFLIKLNYDYKKIFFVPISAKLGENILKKSEKMRWYEGDCLIDLLEKNISTPLPVIERQLIGLVQDIYDIESKRLIITKVESGKIRVNDEIILNLCRQKGKIKSIRIYGEERDFAEAGESIGLEIENVDLDKIRRGEVISKTELNKVREISAEIFLLLDEEIKEGESLEIRCGTAEAECQLYKIEKIVDSSTAEEIIEKKGIISPREAATAILKLSEPMIIEKFSYIPSLGRFLLIKNNKIVAAGIVTD